jgi:fibronectin type 3 domain-containing protein
MTKNQRNNKSIIATCGVLLRAILVCEILLIAGCSGEYGHIPLAGQIDEGENLGQVTLRWNNVPSAISYNVYWNRFPGVTKYNGHKIPDVEHPITVTDLSPGITYYFVVTVVSEAGESAESKEMTYEAAGEAGYIDFEDIATGTDKARGHTGKDQLTLAWDSVAQAKSYNIYWSHSPGVTKHNGKKIANVTNPYTITGLKRGATYYFVVTTVGAFGESDISEELVYTVSE